MENKAKGTIIFNPNGMDTLSFHSKANSTSVRMIEIRGQREPGYINDQERLDTKRDKY
jgi:hypothetical protein